MRVNLTPCGASCAERRDTMQASCGAPYCLDMRNYPMFRNGACMCAVQSLARVRELALSARNLSVLAAVGALLRAGGELGAHGLSCG